MNERLKDKLRRALNERSEDLVLDAGQDVFQPDVEAIIDIVEEVLDGKMVRT